MFKKVQSEYYDIDFILPELVDTFKMKLNEYWTGLMLSFNEVMSEMDVKQIENLFTNDNDERIIEVLSVRIDMVSRKPEFYTNKRSIKRFLKKQRDRVKAGNGISKKFPLISP